MPGLLSGRPEDHIGDHGEGRRLLGCQHAVASGPHPTGLEPGPERDPGAGPGHDGRGRHDRVRGVGRQPGPHLRHEQAEHMVGPDAIHPGVRIRALQHGRGGRVRLAGGRHDEDPRLQVPRLVHGTAGQCGPVRLEHPVDGQRDRVRALAAVAGQRGLQRERRHRFACEHDRLAVFGCDHSR